MREFILHRIRLMTPILLETLFSTDWM